MPVGPRTFMAGENNMHPLLSDVSRRRLHWWPQSRANWKEWCELGLFCMCWGQSYAQGFRLHREPHGAISQQSRAEGLWHLYLWVFNERTYPKGKKAGASLLLPGDGGFLGVLWQEPRTLDCNVSLVIMEARDVSLDLPGFLFPALGSTSHFLALFSLPPAALPSKSAPPTRIVCCHVAGRKRGAEWCMLAEGPSSTVISFYLYQVVNMPSS